MLLRSKTIDLLQTRELSGKQRANSDLNLQELVAQATKLRSVPRRLVLELTNACNLKCIMCGRNQAVFKKTMMTPAKIQPLAFLLDSCEEVTLCGWGEPTVNPYFTEILSYIATFPVRKYLITNGTRLKELEKDLFDCAVDIVAVSMDGACATTNDRIRRGSDFEQVISDLRAIVNLKRKLGVKLPYLNFVFTAMRSNLSELPELVRLAKEIGLDEVKVVYLTVFSEDLLAESLWNKQSWVREVFAEALEEADRLGINLKLPYIQGEDPAASALHKPCFVGWRDFFLGSDGFVRPCQSTALKLFPVDKYQTFEQMWNSPEYQDFRVKVNDPVQMPEECRRCYQSSFANWNREIAFLQIGQEYAPQWEKNK